MGTRIRRSGGRPRVSAARIPLRSSQEGCAGMSLGPVQLYQAATAVTFSQSALDYRNNPQAGDTTGNSREPRKACKRLLPQCGLQLQNRTHSTEWSGPSIVPDVGNQN